MSDIVRGNMPKTATAGTGRVNPGSASLTGLSRRGDLAGHAVRKTEARAGHGAANKMRGKRNEGNQREIDP